MSAATPSSFQLRWYVSVAFVLFIFVLVGVYSSRMAHETTGYDDEQAQVRTARLEKLRASEEKTLTTADWIDKDKGTVRIPINEAMPQEVVLLKAKQPAMGSEIPVITPAKAPAAPAANSAPATNAAPVASTNAPSADTNQPPAAATPSPAK